MMLTLLVREVVQAHRTSMWFEKIRCDSKVYKLLSHEFGVVRPYRTFSIYIVTEIARCADDVHMLAKAHGSMWTVRLF